MYQFCEPKYGTLAPMLRPYRRHLATCPFAAKGQGYTLCNCPIWADGKLNGKRYRKSQGTSDWTQAEQRIKLLTEGTVQDNSARNKLKLADAVRMFVDDARARNLEESTIRGYGFSLTPMLNFFGPETPIASVTTEAVKRFRTTRDIMASTNFKEIVEIKTFFKWSVESGHLAVNPVEKKKLQLPKVEYEPTLPYSEEEIQAMLGACDRITARANEDTDYFRKRARALLLLLLYSGLRISDAAYLRRSALDFKTGYITLRTMKTGVDLKEKLHTDAIDALRKLPAVNPDYFFWDGKSTQLDSVLRYTIKRIGDLAGVKNAHPHRFRDSFACELLLKGKEIRTVQMLLGHESVQTTERHYGHFVASHQALLDDATATLDFSRRKALGPIPVHTIKRRLRNS